MTFPDSTENEKEPNVKEITGISLNLLTLYVLYKKNAVFNYLNCVCLVSRAFPSKRHQLSEEKLRIYKTKSTQL